MRKLLIAVALVRDTTATKSNTLTHNCKAHPSGLVKTVESNCQWVMNWFQDIPNNNCQLENAGNHTIAEIDDYMRKWEDRCCAAGFCEIQGQRKVVNFPIFRGYGCWCSASTLFNFGRGDTKDELDEKCKNLVENYRCIKYDTAKENGDCPADYNDYHIPFSLWIPEDELLAQCTEVQDSSLSDNHKICSIRRCQVDHTLLSYMVQHWISGYAINPDLVWKEFGGPFDPAVECDAGIGGANERTCCGDYPYRLPHNANKVGCCSGQRYGLDSQECCETGIGHQVTEINTCSGSTVPWSLP